MLKLGPIGREEGSIWHNESIWDEAGKSEIVQILISYEEARINSIQFVHVENGDVLQSKIHGELGGSNFNMVTLDYPSEFVISVSGENEDNDLVSIAFGTNKRKYGPYGKKDDPNASNEKNYYSTIAEPKRDKFNYELGQKACFGGFHGSATRRRVVALGIYVKPLTSLDDLEADSDDGSIRD